MNGSKERGMIHASGMGGFLNPPGHPEHTQSVHTDLNRRPENRGSMSLSTAVDCEWLDDSTRKSAREALAAWVPQPLESTDVHAWVLQVLGYFAGCYKGPQADDTAWHVSNLAIDSRDPMEHADKHAGVNLIRRYYPDFTPTAADFASAKWGK